MNEHTQRPLALITGASGGLGLTFARHVAAKGYNVVLVARRLERLEDAAQEIQETCGVEAEPLAADLATDDGLGFVEDRIARSDGLDLLVNNAGFGLNGAFHETETDDEARLVRVHMLATTRLTHAALPGMLERGRGGIISVSSVAGFFQSGASVSYCASKAWINSFTEGLYMLTRGTGVRVQALCPGFTLTEFHDVMDFDRSRVGRGWWMTADDVVEASLRGLEKGKLFVIPGLRYKAVVFLSNLLPRGIRHWLAARRHRPGRASSAAKK